VAAPQLHIADLDACTLVKTYRISRRLAEKLKLMDRIFRLDTGHGLVIFSGYRSPSDQERLAREGRPAAQVDRSTHTTCPATGADVKPAGVFPAKVFILKLGGAAQRAGLRWGGGAPRDADGIPVKGEWRHVDLGPRRS
jgi:hypothetical protein